VGILLKYFDFFQFDWWNDSLRNIAPCFVDRLSLSLHRSKKDLA